MMYIMGAGTTTGRRYLYCLLATPEVYSFGDVGVMKRLVGLPHCFIHNQPEQPHRMLPRPETGYAFESI